MLRPLPVPAVAATCAAVLPRRTDAVGLADVPPTCAVPAEFVDELPPPTWATPTLCCAELPDPVTAIGAVAAMIAVLFAGSTILTPLYVIYQQKWGFSPITLTLIYAVYVIGNIGALFFFGRISDQIGRRRASLPSPHFGHLPPTVCDRLCLHSG